MKMTGILTQLSDFYMKKKKMNSTKWLLQFILFQNSRKQDLIIIKNNILFKGFNKKLHCQKWKFISLERA